MSFATHRRGKTTHRGGEITHRGGRSTHNRGGALLPEKSRKPHKIRLFQGSDTFFTTAIRMNENEMRMNSTSADFASPSALVLHSQRIQKKEVIRT